MAMANVAANTAANAQLPGQSAGGRTCGCPATSHIQSSSVPLTYGSQMCG